jgi:pimeloyl-ACP methyl ester carboxylesterase
VQECLAEAGFELSPDLDRYGTLHAAADLDAYLDAIGADEVVLFGESYGTSLAQVYAARRPERVAGLILDAVVDPTLDALSAAIEQSASFGDVLDQVLESCLDDQWCAGDFLEADPATVWDDLSARLASGPITVEIPVYGGGVREIRLHLNDFINVTGGHLYAPSDRGTFLRLLAFAGRGDLRPLARTSEFVAGRDPERGTVLASADGGVAAYFAINCQGHGHTGTGAIESLRQRLADEVGRMADLALSYLPCLAGFAGPTLERQPDWEALQEADFPTIVLTSTMDPATPQAWAEAVAERLTNAYLIVTRNGAHGTFGLTSCADEVIEDFLLARDLPDDRRTTCHGSVIDLYVPLPYPSLADYADVLDALVAVEEELWSMPDVVYWDGVPNSISCPHGGDMDMRWNAAHELRLNACEVIDGWPLSGPVSFALDGETTMSVDWPDGSVEYESTFDWTVTVVGTVDGRRVDLSR